LQRLVLEMLRVGVRLRKNRHHCKGERQFAIIGAGEVVSHGQRVGRLDAFDRAVSGALLGTALLSQQIEGESDIGRRDRAAVGKFRLRIKAESHVFARGVRFDRLRDQPIERERLIGGTKHEGLINVPRQALRRAERLDVVRIQTVESPQKGEIQPAAFRRVGIGVGQVVEIRAERGRAMHSDRKSGRRNFIRRSACRPRQDDEAGEGRKALSNQPEIHAENHREQLRWRHRRDGDGGVRSRQSKFGEICWIFMGQCGKRAAKSLWSGAPRPLAAQGGRRVIGLKNAPLTERREKARSKGPMMTSLVRRCGALALSLGLVMADSAAYAQSAQKPAASPPAAAPAAPGAPAAGAPPAGGQPQGPVRLELQALQSPWTKICGKDQGNNKEVCYTTRDFGQAADQPPTLAVAVYQMSGDDRRIARFLLPVALMLTPGFRLIIDKGEPVQGHFAICFPNGCFAEAELHGPEIANLKKAQTVSIQVRNQVNNEVTFVVPMKDFAAAFDGPAIDPKVLQQQQQELQKQLEEKAKEQREQLEKQQQSSTPAPAAPPAAPKQ
jgi:invasion protein IalB